SEVDYSALVRELPRMHSKYWVQVSAASRDQLGDGVMGSLKADMPALQFRHMPCTGIASSQ
ncbi:SPOR domain-containing protein, partial [Klebsiella pneumoniae]